MAGGEGALNIVPEIRARFRYRVFGQEGFAGNPTTLHDLDSEASEESLLAHSRQQPTVDNLYYRSGDAPGHYHVRVFSHTARVSICGHALLALAHHLLPKSRWDELVLDTGAYRHLCRRRDDDIALCLPAFSGRTEQQPLLTEALAAAGIDVSRLLRCPGEVWLALCHSVEALRNFSTRDFDWRPLDGLGPGALVLSAPLPGEGYALRYFSPWFGKPEDSATGSAQCYLAPCWLQVGQSAIVRQPGPAGEGLMQVTRSPEGIWLRGDVTP